MQAYSDPARESDPRALPDIEVFYMDAADFIGTDPATWMADLMLDTTDPQTEAEALTGYYYWACLPGCLPDSDPVGPFASAADALADAQDNADE